MKRKTNEEFIEEVRSLVGNEYTFLEEYQDAKTKLKYIHNECGYIHETLPNSFLNKPKCVKCNEAKRIKNYQIKRIKNFEISFYEKYPKNEYSIINEYVDFNTSIDIKHHNCGFIFEIKPYSLRKTDKENLCPICGHNRTRTPESFEYEVKYKKGNEYTVLEPYQGSDVKVKIKHHKCGKVSNVYIPDFFRRDIGCPICSLKKSDLDRRKSNDQFVKEVNKLTNGEYIFLEKYIHINTPIDIMHVKCGNIYKTSPNSFLHQKGGRCQECKIHKKKYTNEEFTKEVYDKVGIEYVFLEEYKGSDQKIRVLHSECGREYKISPTNFLNAGNRCRYCFFDNKSIGETTDVKKTLNKLLGNDYEILNEVSKTRDIVKYKHHPCGQINTKRLNDFLQGSRCPCETNVVWSNKEFAEKVFERVGDEYTVLGDYVNSTTPIVMRHNKCGYRWKTSPTRFLNEGNRCLKCINNSSKGEYHIKEFLINKGIHFEMEYSFDNFSSSFNMPYRYDFFLPVHNLIIEFDGEQHFKPFDFGSKFRNKYEAFNRGVVNDSIKNNFIKNKKKYSLLRLPYKLIYTDQLFKVLDALYERKFKNIEDIVYNYNLFFIDGNKNKTFNEKSYYSTTMDSLIKINGKKIKIL